MLIKRITHHSSNMRAASWKDCRVMHGGEPLWKNAKPRVLDKNKYSSLHTFEEALDRAISCGSTDLARLLFTKEVNESFIMIRASWADIISTAARQKIGGSLTAAKLRADETHKSCNEIMGTHQNLTTSCDMKIEMCPLSFPRSPLECNSSEQLALKDFIVSMVSWEGRSVCPCRSFGPLLGLVSP